MGALGAEDLHGVRELLDRISRKDLRCPLALSQITATLTCQPPGALWIKRIEYRHVKASEVAHVARYYG